MPNTMMKGGLLQLLAVVALCLPQLTRAADPLLPEVPQAQRRVSEAQGCVEPTTEMRRNHMKYILHQRDETMHEGIRTSRFSLKECIDCHVSSEPDAPRVSSAKHFCNSCHSYAAVSIDCFECHADRPAATSGVGSTSQISPSARAPTGEEPPGMLPVTHHALTTGGTNHDR